MPVGAEGLTEGIPTSEFQKCKAVVQREGEKAKK